MHHRAQTVGSRELLASPQSGSNPPKTTQGAPPMAEPGRCLGVKKCSKAASGLVLFLQLWAPRFAKNCDY